jgi:hypothetical protein
MGDMHKIWMLFDPRRALVLAAIGDMPHGMGGFAAERAELATGMLLGGLLAQVMRAPCTEAALVAAFQAARYFGRALPVAGAFIVGQQGQPYHDSCDGGCVSCLHARGESR